MFSTKHTFKSINVQRLLTLLIALFAFWYVFLCLVHLLYQRPLWNDEQCVFLSIERFTTRQIFSARMYSIQVFPRVYLFLIQKFSRIFDYSRWSLRFLPFVCMISAFFLWLKLARYEFKEKLHYLMFVMAWTASGMLLYYSAELKQYSMDVLTAAVFLLFLYNQEQLEKTRNKLYILSLVLLPSMGMFSYTAFICALIPLYNLAVFARRDIRQIHYVFIYGFSLCVFVVLSHFFDMRLRPTNILSAEWQDYFVSFASVGEFFKTFGEGTNNLFSRWFVDRPRYFRGIVRCFVGFGLLYMPYAFFKNIKKEKFILKSLDVIAFVFYIELFTLGALKKYAFTVPRTSLFFCPVVIYLTIKGIVATRRIHKFLYRTLCTLYLAFFMFLIGAMTKITFASKLSFGPRLW